jgi:5'-nucleotidase
MSAPRQRAPRVLLPLLIAALLAACAGPAPQPSPPAATPPAAASVSVKLLAINDFHGNLLPPSGGIRIKDEQASGGERVIAAGGAAHLATAVQQLRAKNPNHVFVAAGDLVGASPLLSALFRDEPTIESLSEMGLEITAVGNHEFDQGLAELLRKQHGGCHPVDGCKGPKPFTGARFQYLAASTWDTHSGKTVLPAYVIKRFEGIPVAFIGLTLEGTPGLVSPAAVAGLRFADEADTVNQLLPELQRQGVRAVVLLIHEGGYPTGDYDECPGISGPIVDIVKRLDRSVGLVVSGHTHRAYNCQIDGRLVTSGDKFGTIVSEIDLELDRASGQMRSARAHNVIVRHEQFPADAQQTALIASYQRLAGPLIDRPVGRISAPFGKDEADAGGGTAMGQLVADAMLAATAAADQGGAQIALTNSGGVRTGLVFQNQGQVSFGDLFASLPFGNRLVTLEMTTEQLMLALEQQWLDQPTYRSLQLSTGLSYQWDNRRPLGQRVLPGSLRLNGQPLQSGQRLRVTTNDFLHQGGDGFGVFRAARVLQQGPVDVEALEAYFKARAGQALVPSALNRAQRVD